MYFRRLIPEYAIRSNVHCWASYVSTAYLMFSPRERNFTCIPGFHRLISRWGPCVHCKGFSVLCPVFLSDSTRETFRAKNISARKGAPIYRVLAEEIRWEAICPGSRASVLTLQGQCLLLRAKAAHASEHLRTMSMLWCQGTSETTLIPQHRHGIL